MVKVYLTEGGSATLTKLLHYYTTMKDALARLEQRLGFLSMIQQQEQVWESDFLNLETPNGSLYQWGLDNGFIHNFNEENEDGTYGDRYGELTDLGHQILAIGADPILAIVQP